MHTKDGMKDVQARGHILLLCLLWLPLLLWLLWLLLRV
jgi:hypothetical protein